MAGPTRIIQDNLREGNRQRIFSFVELGRRAPAPCHITVQPVPQHGAGLGYVVLFQPIGSLGVLALPGLEREGAVTRDLEHLTVPVRTARAAMGITARQGDVLDLLAAGLSPSQMSVRLGLSINTVRGLVQTLLNKFDAHSQVQLLVAAIERGLVTSPALRYDRD